MAGGIKGRQAGRQEIKVDERKKKLSIAVFFFHLILNVRSNSLALGLLKRWSEMRRKSEKRMKRTFEKIKKKKSYFNLKNINIVRSTL